MFCFLYNEYNNQILSTISWGARSQLVNFTTKYNVINLKVYLFCLKEFACYVLFKAIGHFRNRTTN